MGRRSVEISDSQRAEWKIALFELRRERDDALERLRHAWAASPSEWEAMQGTIALEMDRLAIGVQALGTRIDKVFRDMEPEGERQPTGGRDDAGNAPGTKPPAGNAR